MHGEDQCSADASGESSEEWVGVVVEACSPSSAHTCSAVAAAVVDSSHTCRSTAGVGRDTIVAAHPGSESAKASDVGEAGGRRDWQEVMIAIKCWRKVVG